MSAQTSRGDYFDRARSAAVAGMIASAAAAILGALLDWVTITDRPPTVPSGQLERAQPVSGIEAGDGWWVIIAAVIILNAALMLWIRRNNAWAWVAFIAAVVIGGIGIGDYRSIANDESGLLQRLELIGVTDHGIGILLVVAGALGGVIFSLIGVAASPYERKTTGSN